MRLTLRSVATMAIICAASMGCLLPAFADITYKPQSGNIASQLALATITLSGQIRQEDLKQFIIFSDLVKQQSTVYVVVLDSLGGDVETALSIGRIVRKDKAIVQVREDGMCLSSCVFVLAGGSKRSVTGLVGIHRPYAPVDERITADSQKQFYEHIEKDVNAYLQAMNVPAELYDHMIRIPPESVKFLTVDELQRYGLNENDPYEDAATDAQMAKQFGISVQEYIRRRAKINSVCSSVPNDYVGECWFRILSQP